MEGVNVEGEGVNLLPVPDERMLYTTDDLETDDLEAVPNPQQRVRSSASGLIPRYSRATASPVKPFETERIVPLL